MYASYDAIHRRRNVIAVPVIWVAFVLSLLVHLAAMWNLLPRMEALSLAGPDKHGVSPLAVHLAAPPNPRTPSAISEAPAEAPAVAKPRTPRPVRPPPAPTVIAVETPTPSAEAVPVPPPATPAPPVPPEPQSPQPRPYIEGDLTAYIAARRRARGETELAGKLGSAPNAPPVDDDIARRDRIVANNLAQVQTPTFGGEPRHSGGIFQLRRLGTSDAEFTFFGWSKDIRRRLNQKIEVERGNAPDIRIAVVRKMIGIIREYEGGDFRWESPRLGRDVTLSARLSDNAELEAFLMREFFEGDPLPR
jgi:hypothetical protein